MTFIELLRKLEARLGYHQFPLNPAAKSLKDLFECSPLHHELVMRLAQSMFVANGCRRLTDPVARDATLEAVAPIRLQVLQSDRTDIDLYRLIEELCAALAAVFGDSAPPRTPAPARPTAQIISFAPFRANRRIKSWA
ncbi:hypothetical protein [Sulfurifustis variabilis]|uniref:hypothetical protein n=1 Tax=Sulfurifustis variabilis TaxID=1675686 RepID=UPI000BBB0D6C|nr:hypothetical protein [Sulfurifustis variabilis]